MINPMQMIQMIKGGSPQNMILNAMRQQAGNNPVLNNAINLAQKGDVNALKNLAYNIGRENGIDVDQQLEQLKGQFNIK